MAVAGDDLLGVALRDLSASPAGREQETAPVPARDASAVPLPELSRWPSRR